MKKLIFIAACLLIVVPRLNAQDSPATEIQYTVMFTETDNWAYADIYALDPDSGEPVVLMTDVYAQYPVWSPVDEALAFVSGQSTGDDIFIFDVVNQEISNLTQNSAHEVYPRWSPDGRKIAFATDVTGDWEVFVVNRDGSSMMNLSNIPDANDGLGLDWSPDGNHIVFMSNRNGRNGIYVMDADGSNQQLLLPNDPPSADTFPAWSPPTNQIAFVSHRADGYGIYLVNDDGSDLTYWEPGEDFPPPFARYGYLSWSPDGMSLVFEIITGGVNSTELYLIDPFSSSAPIRLTDNELYDAYPSWIPVSALESDIWPVSMPDLMGD